MTKRVVNWNVAMSRHFDRLLPAHHLVDGNLDFLAQIVPHAVETGLLIYDVGGGKNPVIPAELKRTHQLRVVGVDLDLAELGAAPPGSYDRTICADIANLTGNRDGDLAICQAVLEHVPNTRKALAGIATLLKPGGKALIFVPSRNTLYSRLNVVLPDAIKRWLLRAFFPETADSHGFPAFYDDCTPSELESAAVASGFTVETRRLYFTSDYFRIFVPIYVLWRLWLLMFRRLAGARAAETFTLILRRAV